MAKAAAKKSTTTSAPKKAAAKTDAKAPKKAAAKKTGGSGLAKPLTVSPEMAKVVGNQPLPRTEIIKKIWDYIKANDLQDKANRRMINADDTLKAVFEKDQVSMFELAKIVNNHVK